MARTRKIKKLRARRTRRTRRGGSSTEYLGGCNNVDKNLWLHHMMSDMKHDFEGKFDINLRNTLFPNTRVLQPLSEDEMLISLGLKTDDANRVVRYKNNVPNAPIRLDTRCRFALQQKSDICSTEYVSFNPFGKGQNAKIGIIQDCGHSLFDLMGSKNLITFGSVLDQAGKPLSKDKNPRAYIPDRDVPLTFSACVLGFDSGYVRNITISGFTGRTVTCSFETKRPGAGAGAWKSNETNARINTNGGYFLSVPVVKAMIDARSEETPSFLIGKALGDALQTVSAMGTIPGAAVNPYYPIGQILKDISGTLPKATSETITHIIINTCDRLEHARNFAAGKSSTLTSGGQGGSDVVFDYIVGTDVTLTPEIIYTEYLNRFNVLISTVDEAWETLIQNIKLKYTDDSGHEKYLVNSTSSNGLELINRDNGSQTTRAIRCLKGLVIVLETFRICVLLHFLSIYNLLFPIVSPITVDNAATVAAEFEKAASVMHGLVPSSNNTVNKNGRNSVLIHIFKGIKNDQINLPLELSLADVSALNSTVRGKFRSDRKVELFSFFPIQIANSESRSASASFLKGSYSFHTQEIYTLIGKNKNIPENAFKKLFEVFNYMDGVPGGAAAPTYVPITAFPDYKFFEVEAGAGAGAGMHLGGADSYTIFGMTYKLQDPYPSEAERERAAAAAERERAAAAPVAAMALDEVAAPVAAPVAAMALDEVAVAAAEAARVAAAEAAEAARVTATAAAATVAEATAAAAAEAAAEAEAEAAAEAAAAEAAAAEAAAAEAEAAAAEAEAPDALKAAAAAQLQAAPDALKAAAAAQLQAASDALKAAAAPLTRGVVQAVLAAATAATAEPSSPSLIKSFGDTMLTVYDAYIYGMTNPGSIVDHTLFFKLFGDFCNQYGLDDSNIIYEFPRISVPVRPDTELKIEISREVAIFNAWACSYNAEISKTPGYITARYAELAAGEENYTSVYFTDASNAFSSLLAAPAAPAAMAASKSTVYGEMPLDDDDDEGYKTATEPQTVRLWSKRARTGSDHSDDTEEEGEPLPPPNKKRRTGSGLKTRRLKRRSRGKNTYS
jgi:hypothetical protein